MPTAELSQVGLAPHVKVPNREACLNPRLIEPGQYVKLGNTDLAKVLIRAMTDCMRVRIPQLTVHDLFPVRATIWSVAPGTGRSLEAYVRLIRSSGVQVAYPRYSRAYLTVDTGTGETTLHCDPIGQGTITKVSMEPTFADGPGGQLIPKGETALTAVIEFDGETARWAVDPGTYEAGDKVLVRIRGRRIVLA